ncbi:hypothetical protein G6F63_013817 [Rhizopus arrhizus]|nr:hypothetical protein G6F63_013817 [Rhizopus arrhizus]
MLVNAAVFHQRQAAQQAFGAAGAAGGTAGLELGRQGQFAAERFVEQLAFGGVVQRRCRQLCHASDSACSDRVAALAQQPEQVLLAFEQRAQWCVVGRGERLAEQGMQGAVVAVEQAVGLVEGFFAQRLLERVQLRVQFVQAHGDTAAGRRCSCGIAFQALSISPSSCRASSSAARSLCRLASVRRCST